MKLWVKIFLFSVILLILTLNITGFILINKIYDDMLNKEIERCIEEENFISLQMKINSINISKNPDDKRSINSTLSTLMQEYNMTKNNEDKIHGYVELLDSNNEVLYTDMNFPHSSNMDDLNDIGYDKTNYVIRIIENKHYLYASSLVSVYDSEVKIHYSKDISLIYAEKSYQYSLFLKISILICIIFAVFMFFISKLITKPIQILINSTEKISRGNYSERAHINSKDEFKSLALYFNKMADTIENNINELEQSNIEKETLINNLTHELKTPLTSIIGYANLIRTSNYNEDLFLECADYIYKQGKRLEAMTFKMMDLIYAKTADIKLIPYNIMEVLYEVQKVVRIKLENKNISLNIKGEKILAYMDKDLISIAVSNIIDNAIKASQENSKINISVVSKENKALITVEDYGMGIPKEHINKLFQPFYVVDKSRSRKNNGAGIGLSICKKIAEVHNGYIKIESELGKGTKIILSLNIVK